MDSLNRKRRRLSWVFQIPVAVILLQTLFFKFTGAEESVYIFTRLGLEPWGRIGSGAAELVAGILLLIPGTAALGALVAVAVIVGALGAHLTVLGIEVQGDGGLLFGLACAVLLGSLAVLWLRREEIPVLGPRLGASGGKGAGGGAMVLLAVLLLGVGEVGAAAALDPINKSGKGDLALRGFDAVAYFESGEPVRGSADFEHRWQGAVWRFASAEHREQRFVAEPGRYAPSYGGHCAWAASRGYVADGDPEIWKIVDGRLFLNYNRRARKLWEEDIPGNIARADENWPRLLAEE